MQNLIASAQAYVKRLMGFALKLITKPGEFFRTMPKTGGVREPLVYILLAVWLDVLLISIETFVKHGVGGNNLAILLGSLIIFPIIGAILSFFIGGIFYTAWSFMGSKENYETSYRCLAYMQILVPITIMLSFVPYLGLLGIAWWFYLMLAATRIVHGLPIKHALLVFGGVAALSGLIYYVSVSSSIEAKEHLQEFTEELQKMPSKSRW